jgi:hypothetical protein
LRFLSNVEHMNAKDWKTFAGRATWMLSNADQASPRENLPGMALQLRLWRYPCSGVRVSWSILLPVRDYRARRAIVREASWDPSRERKRKAGAEPDVRIRDAEIDWKVLSPFLDKAGGFHPGISGTVAPSAAGTSVAGVEGSRSYAHVRLEWSGRGPRAWAETIAWFERFRKMLARALRKSAPS